MNEFINIVDDFYYEFIKNMDIHDGRIFGGNGYFCRERNIYKNSKSLIRVFGEYYIKIQEILNLYYTEFKNMIVDKINVREGDLNKYFDIIRKIRRIEMIIRDMEVVIYVYNIKISKIKKVNNLLKNLYIIKNSNLANLRKIIYYK